MTARLEFYQSRTLTLSQRHRWRIVALNGGIIAQSSEGYRHIADCRYSAHLALGALQEAKPLIQPEYVFCERCGYETRTGLLCLACHQSLDA